MASHELVAVDRRAFTVEAALALLSGVVITISGCQTKGPENPTGGSSPQPTPTPTPAPGPSPTDIGPAPTPTPNSPGPAPTPMPSPTATPTPTATPMADKIGTISSNHGHVARITGAQLAAGGGLSLNIKGTASHPHTVDLSPAEVTSIASGTRVSKTSSTTNAHDHIVTFN